MPMKLARIPAVALLVVTIGVFPAGAAEQITIEGGGWGHGIGLPQYGAKAMAESGKTAVQILTHFYTGSQLGTVGAGGLTGHANPLRIGAGQNMTVAAFEPVGGPVNLCLGANCSLVATPGDGLQWSIRSNGAGTCQFYNGATPVGASGACEGSLTWVGQPATRVSVSTLGRVYARGKIVFTAAPAGKFHLLVVLGLEEYLYGLGEMPSSWHIEALKAQAIAGRTYALYKAWIYRDLAANQARMDACACHLYASTADQKYIGWAKESEGTGAVWGERWRSAVNATAGAALVHSSSAGRAIQAFYFSSSGGATENNENVWGGSALPYLRSVNDPGSTSWVAEIPKTTFATALGFTQVFSATIKGKFVSGSPTSVAVKGLKNGALTTTEFTSNQLRTLLGLRSHFITSLTGFLPDWFSNYLTGDFDGDGRDEVAAYSTADGSWWVFDQEGSILTGVQWAKFGSKTGWATHVAGDFNGDGRDDVASFHPSNGTWWVSRSTGSGFVTGLWADFSTPSGWVGQMAGDFNGDGRDDIANYYPGNGTWWVSRSTGSSFATSMWADFSTASGWSARRVGDFNGDGRDDIANFHPSNGTWWVSRSTGSGFTTSLWADYTTAGGWTSQLVGDFDGNGRDDIANFHPSNGTWWVSRSTGANTFTTPQLWADYTTASGWSPQLVGDFNGDGRDDVANYYSGNGTWWVSRSTGSAFSTSLKGSISPGKGWQAQLVGDFNGDGADDLSNFYPWNQVWAIR